MMTDKIFVFKVTNKHIDCALLDALECVHPRDFLYLKILKTVFVKNVLLLIK